MPAYMPKLCLHMQVKDLWAVSNALCSGNLNFVVAFDKAGSPRWAHTEANPKPPVFREWKMHPQDQQNLSAASKVINSILQNRQEYAQHEVYTITDADVNLTVSIEHQDGISGSETEIFPRGRLKMDKKVLSGHWDGIPPAKNTSKIVSVEPEVDVTLVTLGNGESFWVDSVAGECLNVRTSYNNNNNKLGNEALFASSYENDETCFKCEVDIYMFPNKFDTAPLLLSRACTSCDVANYCWWSFICVNNSQSACG